MRLWTIAIGVIAAVLIALAGLDHSHTAAALTLAAIGVLAAFVFFYDIGREHGKREAAPSVHLAGVGGAIFSARSDDYMVLWLQLKARNHHQATVLTDWNAVLTLGDSMLPASHSFNDPFLPEMKNQIALDQQTAVTPLHGEVTGWVAFGVGLSRAALADPLDQGKSAKVKVSVQDSQSHISSTEIDLAQLWRNHHEEIRGS